MNNPEYEVTRQQGHQILSDWLASCTRHGKIARNTVAMGIVVLDHLRRTCPVLREQVISAGGEVSGARSGLGATLEAYGIPRSYLKEVTTRQGHQDGQRLFEQLGWGAVFAGLSDEQREELLLELAAGLRELATEWLTQQNLRLELDRRQAPATWVSIIMENARGRSGGVVEQHLVGAKLARRFSDLAIPNYPAHAADRQTERLGDFAISRVVYHVTSAPSLAVLQKCAQNVRAGYYPLLVVPRDRTEKARNLAEEVNIEKGVTIVSIEDFIALNIIELATDENKEFFAILREIVELYNRRLSEVETDMSLKIEVR